MSQLPSTPWSNNPYAPQIPKWLYLAEKENFAGMLIGAIFYGAVIVLFFQCMRALFDPVNRKREGTRWGLVTYAVVMFSIVTVFVGTNLSTQSVSYIDYRAFPGTDELPPGPFGYQVLLYSKPISIVTHFTFLLNNWLADGLLLYRCYVIYSKNLWAIAFPFLMYLASIALGIITDYTLAQPNSTSRNTVGIYRFGVSYFTITLLLNVLLTVMIVVRLHLHNRMLQSATGGAVLDSRPHSTVVAMLTESCALYAVCLLLYLVPWGTKSFVEYIFLPLLADVQVMAPLLIILRVANRRAFHSTTSVSKTENSFRLRSRGEVTSSSGTHIGGYSTGSTENDGKCPGGLAVGVVTTVDLHRDAEV